MGMLRRNICYCLKDRAWLSFAGGYLPIDKSEGPEAQYSYYQQTYNQASQSLSANTGLKGLMFWRWAGVDPTAKLADFDEAATIGAPTTSATLVLAVQLLLCMSA